ncbi:amino acid/amide ABC transporter substrate-binding protein (HAAT family) [Orenia metallireducens]|uniref:Amino acid/amide ABC transporter substrate-binding protein, HAAT family n=1 Tax=Orenia metallireducens TaxID=1413210 RepID=A0A285I124_9FIRM|nr:ABC transporter substrate-binding protein [Orenia metallireducens]PRX29294.1 amino acid/amide ABC transporter substrate-binding protein (HAAT family) [Orenia metallireducens]SNY40746.1 amino acid/amide ABC transporter substrate-binding protein, HAAT family [Orenia metallireducens]
MFKKRKFILSIILSLVLALLLTACGGNVEKTAKKEEATSKEVIKVGTLVPLTGGLASYGQFCQQATILAEELINEQGGLLDGKKLKLVHMDTQTNPQAGVDAAQKLVSINNVPAFVGALSSGVSIPVAESVAVPNQVVQISPSSTSPVITGLDDNDFVFRTVPSDSLQGIVAGDLAVDLGYKKMAIIYVNNDYGKGLSEAVTAEFEQKSGTITSSIGFEPNKASYRGELQKAAEGDPEVLYLIAYTDDGGTTIIRQSLEGGFFDKFLFSDGLKAPEVAEGIEKYLEGTYGTAPTSMPGGNGPELFKAAYKKEFGKIPPKPYMDTSYDATFVIALGIEKAGKADGPAIQKALRELLSLDGVPVTVNEWSKAKQLIKEGKKIRYEGASGPVFFNEAGDVQGAIGIWKISNGDIVSEDVIVK